MSNIFATPESLPSSGILFLHGLEGSSTGSKATHLKSRWDAACPSLRTKLISELKTSKANKAWRDLDDEEINFALGPVYEDAVQAVRYYKPNIVIGSSMGGAILYRMASEGILDSNKTSCIFLAPAIHELVYRDSNVTEFSNSYWVFGESDRVISKKDNLSIALKSKGNIIFSPNDSHRLKLALDHGLIDACIVSSMELSDVL